MYNSECDFRKNIPTQLEIWYDKSKKSKNACRGGFAINTRQLRSFLIAAECKSLSGAALQLNYSQSTIHEHLGTLEDELGVQLYHRLSKGIELTPKGDLFLIYARQILDLCEEAQEVVTEKSRAVVRMAASECPQLFVVNNLIKEYMKLYPQVEIVHSHMTTDISVPKVAGGHCDLAFACDIALNAGEVECSYLCSIPMVFVARSDHPAVRDGIRSNQNMRKVLIGTMTLVNAKAMLASVGLSYDELFDSLTVIGGLSLVRDIVLGEKVIALLPAQYVQGEIKKNKLSRIPDLKEVIQWNVYIVTQKRKRLSAASQNMIKLARQRYGNSTDIENHKI